MAKKHSNLAFDFTGTLDQGTDIFMDGAYIITGEPEENNEDILKLLGDKKPKEIFNYPDQDELNKDNFDIKVAIWKARTLKALMKLGVDTFYDDSEPQIQIIKEMNPSLNIVKVIDGIPQLPMNFIIFTYDGSILPVAEKLEKEGNRVIVGQIEDKKKILLPEEEYTPENPEKRKQRLQVYNGIIEKYSADEVLKMIKKIKDKEEWIVLTDSNSNFFYTEKALEMGFVNGIFPTAEDRSMECDRKKSKDFVKEHYPDVKVAEVKIFKEVAEAIAFLKESEDLWVLKSCGDSGDTVCPNTEDVDVCREEIVAKLEEMKKEYEENGLMLEPRILEPIELTPEMVFVDGVPVVISLDIEIKNIGIGSSVQTGCMANLIVRTDIEDRINKIAFPEIVHEMAKKRKGLFCWDISLLIDKKGTMYFGEFCSQRFGWDSFPTELVMSADDTHSKVVTPYFAALLYKKNPLRKQFGVGVRMLNIGTNGKLVDGGIVEVDNDALPCTFLYEVRGGIEGGIVSNTQGFDFGVTCSASDDLYEAINECYEYVEKVIFEAKYYRAKEDFMSYGYPQSIMRRYDHARYNNLISSEGSNGLSEPKNY